MSAGAAMHAGFRSACGPLVAAAVLALRGTGSLAQTYPVRPIRLISPNPAGGGNDTVGRLAAGRVAELLNAQIVSPIAMPRGLRRFAPLYACPDGRLTERQPPALPGS